MTTEEENPIAVPEPSAETQSSAETQASAEAQSSAGAAADTEVKKLSKSAKRSAKKKEKKLQATAARAYAIQLMYSLELNGFDQGGGESADQGADQNADQGASASPRHQLTIDVNNKQSDLHVTEAVQKKSQELMAAFIQERTAIDACVDAHLQKWTLMRLAHVDRAILRLACLEIMYHMGTAPHVTINEYIELSKQYGSEEKTPKLVNAVLDKIARKHRPDELKPKK